MGRKHLQDVVPQGLGISGAPFFHIQEREHLEPSSWGRGQSSLGILRHNSFILRRRVFRGGMAREEEHLCG